MPGIPSALARRALLLFALAIGLLAAPRRAAAECELLPQCDIYNSSCWVCEGDGVSSWSAGDSADSPIKPTFNFSPGADLGRNLWLGRHAPCRIDRERVSRPRRSTRP